MRILIKIVLTIIAFMIAVPFFAILKEIIILKLVILAGLVAAITAIWKYKPNNDNDDKLKSIDNQQLDKNI